MVLFSVATTVAEQANREPAGVVVRVDPFRGARGVVALLVRLPIPDRALPGSKPVRVREMRCSESKSEERCWCFFCWRCHGLWWLPLLLLQLFVVGDVSVLGSVVAVAVVTAVCADVGFVGWCWPSSRLSAWICSPPSPVYLALPSKPLSSLSDSVCLHFPPPLVRARLRRFAGGPWIRCLGFRPTLRGWWV